MHGCSRQEQSSSCKGFGLRLQRWRSILYFVRGYNSWTNQPKVSDPAKATSATAAAAEVAQTAALQATETPLILLWLSFPYVVWEIRRGTEAKDLCVSQIMGIFSYVSTSR